MKINQTAIKMHQVSQDLETRSCVAKQPEHKGRTVECSLPGQDHAIQKTSPVSPCPSSSTGFSIKLANRLTAFASTMVNAPTRCIAKTFINTLWLASKIDGCIDSACQTITASTDRSKLLHQKEVAIQNRNIKKALSIKMKLKTSTWGDCVKNIISSSLRVTQYTYRTLLAEVKACADDWLDLHDHFALTGNQIVPNHFFDALNASRASCMFFGGDGVGVMPCESPEQIIRSRTRFGILQTFYSYWI